MPLPRKAMTGLFDKVEVNVWDVLTKKIVYTGSQLDAANFLGIQVHRLRDALSRKYRIKRRYAIRIKSEKQ